MTPPTTIQDRILAAYQQTPLWALPAAGWTLPTPGDAAAAVGSAHWAPVHAELQRLLPPSATTHDKRTAHTQVLAMLKRTDEELGRSSAFDRPARIQVGSFLQTLIQHYGALAAA